MIATVTPVELAGRHATGEPCELIDVRTPAEFAEMHVPFARNAPLERLDAGRIAAEHAGVPVFVICRSGNRGQQACQRLAAVGLDVTNVAGGTLAWEAAGLPLVRGRATISLERQVRIAAGSLVVLSAVLGLFVHPYLIGLAAFVGAGLVFAGITDTCGMGMLLARMPWNQAAGDSRPTETSSCCEVPGEQRQLPH